MNALTYSWSVIGGVAGLWMLGLLLLARVPATPAPAESSSLLPTPTLVTGADAEPFPDLPIHAPPNLEAAARVCTAMAQMTSADDLNRLLHQAAAVLEASGFVVWMAAGEELFAAAAVGYSPQIVRTLGPINRSAMNATAAACRSGTLQVVSADLAGRSAVAAPMLASDRCVGVLAVEVSAGREEDSTTRAIATMFAAQLTAALAGWPAASAAAPVHVPPLDRAAEA